MCKRCFEKGTSCCTTRSSTAGEMVIPPASRREVEEVLAHTGHVKIDSIYKKAENSPFFVRHMMTLFPGMESRVFRKFSENDFHYELRTIDQACVLLGANGCILPDRIRPLFCRIYPFWFFNGEPQIFQDPDCLALQDCETIPELLLCLGIQPGELERIHDRICQDWGFSLSNSHSKMKAVF